MLSSSCSVCFLRSGEEFVVVTWGGSLYIGDYQPGMHTAVFSVISAFPSKQWSFSLCCRVKPHFLENTKEILLRFLVKCCHVNGASVERHLTNLLQKTWRLCLWQPDSPVFAGLLGPGLLKNNPSVGDLKISDCKSALIYQEKHWPPVAAEPICFLSGV